LPRIPPRPSTAGEWSDRVGEAVGLLPRRDQIILGLHYYDDLNFVEIGAVLGISGSQVSRLHTKAPGCS
jgi:RNA polymerase sigma factor FliA